MTVGVAQAEVFEGDRAIKYGQKDFSWKYTSYLTNENTAFYVNSKDSRGGFQFTGVEVEAGVTYTLSFDAEILSGRFRPTLGIKSSNYDFEKFYPSYYRNGGMTNYTRTFTVPTDYKGDFRLVFKTRNAEVWVDNIEIKKISSPQN
jgi:hypothetical protein